MRLIIYDFLLQLLLTYFLISYRFKSLQHWLGSGRMRTSIRELCWFLVELLEELFFFLHKSFLFVFVQDFFHDITTFFWILLGRNLMELNLIRTSRGVLFLFLLESWRTIINAVGWCVDFIPWVGFTLENVHIIFLLGNVLNASKEKDISLMCYHWMTSSLLRYGWYLLQGHFMFWWVPISWKKGKTSKNHLKYFGH